MGILDWIPSWLLNYDAFEETENEDLQSIGIVAGYNAIAALILWSYWTYKRWNDPGFFSPKRTDRPPDLPGPKEGLFKWVWKLYKIPEEEFLRYAGFDSLVYIRFYMLAFKICGSFALFAWPVIVPVNYSGGEVQGTNNMNKISMSNIPSGSPLMWVMVLGMCLLTLITFFFLDREFRAYTNLRQRYLQQRKPHMRTIMIDLPKDARSNAILESYFAYLYPGDVLSARCTQDLTTLRGLLKKRENVLVKLERAMMARDRYSGERGGEPKMWTGPFLCPCIGNRVGAVTHLTSELNFYNTEVSREQAKRLHHLRMMDDRARRMAAAGTLQRAIQAIMSQESGQLISDDNTGPVEQLLMEGAEGGSSASSSDDDELSDTHRDALGVGGSSMHMGIGKAARRRGTQVRFRDQEEEYSMETRGKELGEGNVEDWGGQRHGGSKEGLQGLWRHERQGNSTSHGGRGKEEEDVDALQDVGMEGGERVPLLRRGIGHASSRAVRKINFPEMTPRAFITFRTFSAATVARQVLHGAGPGRMSGEEAPEARDIYWFNTGISKQARKHYRVAVEAFLLLLYVFWVVPATLLYLILSVDSLTARWSWVADLYHSSAIFAALIELLQPVVLLVLMSMLPPLIRILGMLEGSHAESSNQLSVLSRYFNFQVINVFLVTTLAGTLVDTVSEIVHSPEKTFTLLGESLPKVAGFFSEYILIKMLSGLPIEITRLVSWTQEKILVIIWPRETPRDKAAVVFGLRPYFNAGWFNYPKYYAQDLLVVVVCLTYACVNPFILVCGVPYFLACHIAYKHQMLYVYEPLYETGGVFFPKIFRRVVFAMLIAQATMIGILLLKSGFYEAIVVGILMVVTWFYKSAMRGSYEPVALSLPLEIAKVLDDMAPPHRSPRDRDGDPDGFEADPRTAYLQPSLKAEPLARPEIDRDHPTNVDFARYHGRV